MTQDEQELYVAYLKLVAAKQKANTDCLGFLRYAVPLFMIAMIAIVFASCSAERVRIKTLQEGRIYDDKRPILSGPTKGQQRPGLPQRIK